MDDKNAIQIRLAEIRRQKKDLKKQIDICKSLSNKLSAAEKILTGLSQALINGKVEGVLRHFVE